MQSFYKYGLWWCSNILVMTLLTYEMFYQYKNKLLLEHYLLQ